MIHFKFKTQKVLEYYSIIEQNQSKFKIQILENNNYIYLSYIYFFKYNFKKNFISFEFQYKKIKFKY